MLLSSSVNAADSSAVKLITSSPCTSELAAPYVSVLSDFLTVLITFRLPSLISAITSVALLIFSSNYQSNFLPGV